MNAIQRWYFYPLEEHGHELRQLDGNEFPDDELWCRAKDVAELERVISSQSSKHSETMTAMRERIEFLQGMLMKEEGRSRFQNRIINLKARNKYLEGRHEALMSRPDKLDLVHMELNYAFTHGRPTAEVDAIMNKDCPDGECSKCAVIICPHRDGMHFHHDGCPSCAEHET